MLFFFIILFFALHLMPVWIWLGNVLTINKKWQNTEYAITDKRIIIMTGFIGMDYQSLYYKDIENVYEIYPKLQKVVLDIQTDIEFPNNLRPKENDGYDTKYTG